MRYDDAFQAVPADAIPTARPDLDALNSDDVGAATGNVISGAGTVTGTAGADSQGDVPGRIVGIRGDAGSSEGALGSFQVAGRYGVLTIEADGSYSYTRNPGTPGDVQDVFTYTLADSDGDRSTATLTIDIRGPLGDKAQSEAEAQRAALADGAVSLPAGVELSDIRVVGRDLVVTLPDGSQMVIPGGAVFVPQLVIGDVEVPASNLAALLVNSEPQPAAGVPQSGGGNFGLPVAPLDPGVALGDLVPPTEMTYTPPTFEEVGQFADREPEVFVQPDGQPASQNAVSSVQEAALPARGSEPAGSNSASPNESTTGTILVASPDAPNQVAINGVPVTAVGQIISGQFGSLTITGIGDDAITYRYTLLDNTPGDSTAETFTITVTDRDDDVATATLRIDITDDVPTANDDAAGLSEGGPSSVTFDVDLNDVTGADGIGSRTFASLNGTYGSIVLNADGTQTYVLNASGIAAINALAPGATLTDSFAYTLTDGDGDSDPATLVITLTGTDDPVQITNLVPALDGGEGTLDEDDLPAGSDTAKEPLSLEGTFTISTPDGLDDLLVGGTAVISNGAYVGGTVTTELGNSITFTGYNPATGQLSYTFTLTGSENHPVAAGENSLFDSVAVVLTDSDGDSASSALAVRIVDDVPTANDDRAVQSGEAAAITIGAVANDIFGADGVDLAAGIGVVAGSLSGAGSLSYNGDGTFTYLPAAGEQGTVTFQYRIVDGDGDPSVATVTIELGSDSTPTILVAEGSDTTVMEAALAIGSNPASNDEFAAGTLVVTTGNDTLTALVVNGVDVTNGGTVDGQHGVLTISGSPATGYSYSYELTDPTVDLAGAETDDFSITVTDSDGDTAATALSIAIVDDTPRANDDSYAIAEDDSDKAISFDVDLNDVAGADGTASRTFSSLVGTYGNLTLNADGTQTYTLNATGIAALSGLSSGETLSDSFAYTLTDGDGDSDPATLTITLGGSDDGVTITNLTPAVSGGEGTVDEDDLPAGTDPVKEPLTVHGTFNISAPDGVDDLMVGGVPIIADGTYVGGTVTTPLGNRIVFTGYNPATGELSYTYTLLDNAAHPESGDLFDTVSVTLTDSDGDSDSDTLSIKIVDDTPIAANDQDRVAEGIGNVADGNVLTGSGGSDANTSDGSADNGGADGPATVVGARTGAETAGSVPTNNVTAAGVVINGTYGDLLIKADGSYVYTLTDPIPAGVSGETFTYAIRDGDGDVDFAELQIDFTADARVPDITGSQAKVFEDGLADGDQHGVDSETISGSFTVNPHGESYILTIGGTVVDSVGDTVDTGEGTLTITDISAPASDGKITYSYSYTLGAALTHSGQGEINDLHDLISINVTDATGDSAVPGQIDIAIGDDVPIVGVAGNTSVVEGATATGSWTVKMGADQSGSVAVVFGGVEYALGTAIPTGNGTLTVASDGTWSFVASSNLDNDLAQSITFSVQATDGDGDIVSAPQTVLITDGAGPFGDGTLTLELDDEALPGGNLNDSGATVLDSGTLSFTAGSDALTSFAFDTDLSNLDGNLSWTRVSDTLIEGRDGGNLIVSLSLSAPGSIAAGTSGTVTVTATLADNYDAHPGIDLDDLQALGSVLVVAGDHDGNSATGTVSLGVSDDVPLNNGGTVDFGVVHEDALENAFSDGNREGSGQVFEQTISAAQLATLVSVGADSPAAISLNAALTGPDSIDGDATDLTQYGQSIVWDVVSATEIRGVNSVTGRVVFTITDNPGDDDFTFTLLDNIDHDSDGNLNTGHGDSFIETLQLAGVFKATDADGDSVVIDAGASIDIENDVPASYATAPGTATGVNEVGTSDTESLNLPAIGADEPGKLTFGVTDGAPVMDATNKQLSSNGELLVWSLDPSNPSVLTAETTGGAPIFTITLNDNGTYTYAQLGEITSTSTLSITDLRSIGGGNVDAKAINVPNSQFDLVLTTKPGSTVNTNANEIGVGSGNSFEAGEHLRIDLVQNAFVSGSGGSAVLNYGEYYSANSYRQDVSGLGGSQTANFIVRAIVVNENPAGSSSDPADGDNVFYGDANDTVVATTSIRIYSAAPKIGGTLVDPADYPSLGISVTPAAGGGWLITGLPNDYDFEIVSATPFNAVQVEAASITDTFKLGYIDITAAVRTEVDFSVPITLTDSDGDPVRSAINVHLAPSVGATGARVIVDESALNDSGSNPGSTAETQSGSLADAVAGGVGPFTYTLLDPADGQYGTLTLNSSTGAFTYTLDTAFDSNPEANNGRNAVSGAESFDYQIFDAGTGKTTTGTITIDIVDDVPTARADSDLLENGATGPATGNVITDNHSGDAGDGDTNASDIVGADQPGRVAAITFGTTTEVVPPGGSVVIDGDHGTLTIWSNGDYSYVRDDGLPINDSDIFTYTLTDGDGDTSSATLTITLEDQGVTSTVPTAASATWVYETALDTTPLGRNEALTAGDDSDPRQTVTGSIAFAAPDGFGSITIGTTIIDREGAFPQTVADSDSLGTLRITGVTFDSATGLGSIAYQYTLEDNALVSGASTSVSFAVDVVDSDGDHAPASNLTITIADDEPLANDDDVTVAEGGILLNGSVLTNDLSGADDYAAKKVVGGVPGADDSVDTENMTGTAVVIAGNYGTLTLRADGTYDYDADPNTNPPAGAKDEFVYTIKDGDGDLDSAVLTIEVTNVTLVADMEDRAVAEAALDTSSSGDLAASAVTGSNPGSPGETVTGQLDVAGAVTFKLADGGSSATTALGQLQLNSDGSYTYTLTNPVLSPTGNNGNNTFNNVQSFEYVATDANGNTVNGFITIDVVDDKPTAVDDSDRVTEGLGNSTGGNLLSGLGGDGVAAGADTAGADGITVTGARLGTELAGGALTGPTSGSITINGLYGQLVLGTAGGYTYTLTAASIPAGVTSETFTYEVTDGDGDKDLAQLVISLDQNMAVPTITGSTATVHEDGLADGVQYGASSETATSRTFTINPNGESYTLTLGGVENPAIGTPIDTGEGTLTITAISAPAPNGAITYTYDYTLKAALAHSGQGEVNAIHDLISISVTDATGDSAAPGEIDVSIVDDVPVGAPDTDALAGGSNGPATGNVLTGVEGGNVAEDTFGPDGVADNAGADGLGRVVAIDSNHDPLVPAVAVPQGGSTTVAGQFGLLTIYANGDYSYARTPGLGGGATETFTYTFTDGDGDTAQSTLTIAIGSSPPQVTVTGSSPTTGADDQVWEKGLPERGTNEPAGSGESADNVGTDNDDGSERTTGTIAFTSADGVKSLTLTLPGGGTATLTEDQLQALTGTTTHTINGSNYSLVLSNYSYTAATGLGSLSYAFTLTDNTLADPSSIAFTVAIEDDDGDTGSDTLTIKVNDDAPAANADTDSVATGSLGPAVGNVISDSENDGGKDVVGADGAVVVGVAAGNTGANLDDPSKVGVQIGGAYGKLTINADGSYSYSRNAGTPGGVQDVFTYTIKDGDGDLARATLTISIGDKSPVATTAAATVDDDGLTGANKLVGTNDLPDANADGDNSEATFTGTLGGTPGDGASAFRFPATIADQAVGQETVSFAVSADGLTLTATGPRGTLFTVQITDSATGAYKVTLADNVLHATENGVAGADNTENVTDATVTLPYSMFDADNDPSTAGQLTITFDDDVPTLAVSGDVSVVEGATATGSWTASAGADQPGATTVVFFGGNSYALGAPIDSGKGTLTVNANGTWTFASTNNLDQDAAHAISFTIRVTDADGDYVEDPHSVAITDGAAPGSGGTVNLTVAESALDLVKDSADLAAGTVVGTNPASTAETSAVSSASGLHFAAGSDAIISVAFSLASAPTVSGLAAGHSISWTINSSGQLVGSLMNGSTNLGTAIILQLTGETGAAVGDTADVGVTATLVGRLEHLNPPAAQGPITISGISVVASDHDGESATGLVNVTVTDDAPILGVIQNGTANNNPASVATTGTLNLTQGADDISSLTIAVTSTSLKAGGIALSYSQTGNVLTAYADADADGAIDAGEAVFTISADPDAGTSGRYTFDLLRALDGQSSTVTLGQNTAYGSGPSGSVTVSQTGLPNLVYVTGGHAVVTDTASEDVFDFNNWIAGGYVPTNQIQAGGVNGSTQGWGVNSNNFDARSFMRFDFGKLDDYDGPSGSYAPPAQTMQTATSATFDLFQYDSDDRLYFLVHGVDGSVKLHSFTGTAQNSQLVTVTAQNNGHIAWIDVYTPNAGSGKIDLESIGIISTTTNVNVPVTLTFTDGDGDTVSGSFTINVADGNSPSSAAPVVLDLDGDGAEFLSQAAGVAYDYDGDGAAESTAWVAANDGILVRDSNANGQVDGASEFVFGGNGATDLEALAARYGSTLDAADSDFAKFAVWQDANSNGTAEAGELRSLTSLGITSVGLVSDGVAYTAAGGEVSVAGTASYSRADGSTWVVADAAFAVGSAAAGDQSRQAAAANTSVLLAAAAAAAGAAAGASAAADGAAPSQTATGSLETAAASIAAGGASGVEAAKPGDMVSSLPSGESKELFVEPGSSAPDSGASAGRSGELDGGAGAPAPADLPAGTDVPAQASPAPAAADMIAIPSAEMLQGLGGATDGEQAADVAQVVADALAGGAGSDIDALLAALPSPDGADPALAIVASGGDQGGSAWDTGHFADFTNSHASLSPEAMVLHPDAVQAA